MSEKFPVRKKIVWNAIKNCTKRTLTTFEIDESITSPNFKILVGGDTTEWYLRLYPRGAHSPSHMNLCLVREDDLDLKFTFSFSFYVNGKSERRAEILFRLSSDVFKRGRGQGNQFLSLAKFEESFDELVVDGIFKVCCEISISKWDLMPKSSFSKNIQRMYDDDLFKDFELRCSDGKILKCHKAILATQSPVFRVILTNNMKKTNQGFAEVPDFDSVVMTEVLRFMYGFPNDKNGYVSEELIFAAEKYDLDELKQACIKNIALNLTTENVIDALIITGKVSGSEKLFQECITVIAGNSSKLTKKLTCAGLSDILIKAMNCTIHMISSLETEHIN